MQWCFNPGANKPINLTGDKPGAVLIWVVAPVGYFFRYTLFQLGISKFRLEPSSLFVEEVELKVWKTIETKSLSLTV
jgi:hypothetical protein